MPTHVNNKIRYGYGVVEVRPGGVDILNGAVAEGALEECGVEEEGWDGGLVDEVGEE